MGNLRMNADQISYKGGEKPMSVEQAIKNAGNTGLAHTADIAPDFSTESAYSAGDYVYHNGTLYAFTSNHAAGAWSTSDTQAVTVGGELADVKSGLTSKIDVTHTSNLNDCIKTGIYTFPWDATGVPSGHSGVMLVMRILTADTGLQIARVSSENTIYVRFFDVAVFSAWQTITLGS